MATTARGHIEQLPSGFFRVSVYAEPTRLRASRDASSRPAPTKPPVLAGIMGRDDGDLSASEQIRQSQDRTGGTGHLLTLWTAAARKALYLGIDQQITARLSEPGAWRYDREPSRQALQQRLRAAQLAGHDISSLIDQITAAPMDGARSIASILHGLLQRIPLPVLASYDLTWAQRTPASAPAVARELAASLDVRARALGDQLTASPEPWLARHLGVLAPDASPTLREEHARRAGAVAAYREAAGITGPQQAVSPAAHGGSPELEGMRQATIRALGDSRRSRHHARPDSRGARSPGPGASSKPRPWRPTAPRPPPRRRHPPSSGSSPRPKPTPGSKPPRPPPSTTTPRSQARKRSRPDCR
jgi:hypothetical protein